MRLNINDLRHNKPGLIRMYKNIPERDKIRRIGLVAIATHTHLVAIHQFILEEFGPDEEIEKSMNRLIKDYRITEVIK